MRALARVAVGLATLAAAPGALAQAAVNQVDVICAPWRGEASVQAGAAPDMRVHVQPGRIEIVAEGGAAAFAPRRVTVLCGVGRAQAADSEPRAPVVERATGGAVAPVAGWVMLGAGALGFPISYELGRSLSSDGAFVLGGSVSITLALVGIAALLPASTRPAQAAVAPRWWLGAGPAPLGGSVGATF